MTDADIPLDITGHEERDPPGAESAQSDTAAAPAEGADGDEERVEEVAGNGERADGVVGDALGEDNEAEANDEATDEEVEPVEVLVQLAEDGEIDPWDIDIVSVTDKFLARLDEADLRTSGRALFYASVLLRMKGDAMLAVDEPAEPEPWEAAMVEEGPIDSHDPFATLETEMDRRLERRRARGMPQTLDELVRDLRDAERDSWWKESREYDTSGGPEGYHQGTQELDYHAADHGRMAHEPTEDDVTGKTHKEDIETVIDEVYARLREHYDQDRTEVLYREISDAGGSRVRTFLALLFLSHRGQVRLSQDDLFGDLWIQDPAAATGSDEALAD